MTWNEALRVMEGADLIAEDAENADINDRDLETWEEFNRELEER